MPIEEDEHGTHIMNLRTCAPSSNAAAGGDGTTPKIEGRTKSPYYGRALASLAGRHTDDAVAGRELDPVGNPDGWPTAATPTVSTSATTTPTRTCAAIPNLGAASTSAMLSPMLPAAWPRSKSANCSRLATGWRSSTPPATARTGAGE